MNFLSILQTILGLAPTGIQITKEVVGVIQEIETVVAALPTEHQTTVANLAAKALVTNTAPASK